MSLFETWQRLAEEIGGAQNVWIAEYFQPYSTLVCEMVAADARQFSRLSDCGERAYERLAALMVTYTEVITVIAYSAESGPRVNELLAGIYDILQSRQREFEDAKNTPDDNPVAAEKYTITHRARLYTQRQIENTSAQFLGKLPDGAQHALRRAFLLANGEAWRTAMRAALHETAFTEIYTHYRDGLRFCLLGLDDLHGRKAARFYIELLAREWEVLHDLICVQAQALEAVGNGAEVPTRVLTLLREAYQQTGPLVEALQRLPHSGAQRAPQHRDYEAFTQALDAAEAPPFDLAQCPGTAAFFEALDGETDALFGAQRITFLKAAYRLQRMASDEILLAEEAAAVFKTAHTSLIKDRIDTTDTEKQILHGIAETLDIKVSALKESINDFNGESAGLLQNFAKEKNDVTDEIKAAAYAAIRAAWLDAPPASAENIPAFFAECQENPPFVPTRTDYEKHVSRYNEKMEKAALRFRKEILLYEVATYEEILTHSVSRLRASENPLVQATAARLTGTYAALEVLLKKNNVTPIRPAPHDPFNGREHEVLVAEKQEGFSTGEIIKLVGSGYRYKDAVLVRANVIAAK